MNKSIRTVIKPGALAPGFSINYLLFFSSMTRIEKALKS